MVPKGILLFDIDRVILDEDKITSLFNDNILKVLQTTNIERIKDVKSKYKQTLSKPSYYAPEIWLNLLAKEFNFIYLNKLLNVYYGKEYRHFYSDCVYPDFFEVALKLKKKFRLGIFSEGTKKYQNHKFKSMKLDEYFDADIIFIIDAKDTPEVISKIPKGAIVIDDKESICDFLFENGIKCIWLNKKDNNVSKKYQTIHNLLELPGILL